MGKVHHTSQQLADAGCHRRAPYTPIKDKDKDVIQQTICQTTACYRNGSQTGIPVGFDKYLKVIRNDKAQTKGNQAGQILLYILQCTLTASQQLRKGGEEEEYQRRNAQTNDSKHHQILRKQTAGRVFIPVTQAVCKNGGRAYRKNHSNGKEKIRKRETEIHCRHSQLSHTLGDENTVYRAVQRKHQQRKNGRHHESGKIPLQGVAFQGGHSIKILSSPGRPPPGRGKLYVSIISGVLSAVKANSSKIKR